MYPHYVGNAENPKINFLNYKTIGISYNTGKNINGCQHPSQTNKDKLQNGALKRTENSMIYPVQKTFVS